MTNVPLIVTTCVQEVERRGINDVGIYRISGLSAEIQKMRKAFEKSENKKSIWLLLRDAI